MDEGVSKEEIKIKSGGNTLLLPQDDIALFHSRGGIITVQTKEDRKFITQFSSLDDLEKKLVEGLFFRVSRQLLIHRTAIQGYKSIANSRLEVQVRREYCNGFSDDIVVSRYRRKEFIEWITIGSL